MKPDQPAPSSRATPVTTATKEFLAQAGVDVPLICGAMYPCSNPELVGAVSAAGGLGIVQPISLTFVHGHDMREGLRLTQRLAGCSGSVAEPATWSAALGGPPEHPCE